MAAAEEEEVHASDIDMNLTVEHLKLNSTQQRFEVTSFKLPMRYYTASDGEFRDSPRPYSLHNMPLAAGGEHC